MVKKKYADLKINTVYNEDCLKTMAKMPDNFINLTITSPPYDSMRKYKGYTFDFKAIARELYRVTKEGGVVVWVVGDQTIKGSESGTSFKQALYFKEIGFRLHDTMIYQKGNFSMPDRTRYHQIFEYMFVFSKGKPSTFNPIVDRKNKSAGSRCFSTNTKRVPNGGMRRTNRRDKVKELGRRYNIWQMNTAAQEKPCQKLEHPAIFPAALARDHIKSWSLPGDLVYDPMLGSGTTASMAIETGRNFIGSEISKEYCKLARKTIKGAIKFLEY